MRLTEAGRLGIEHQKYRDDGVREQEGLQAELSPPDRRVQPLENRIMGSQGRNTEEDMQMLMTSGGI